MSRAAPRFDWRTFFLPPAAILLFALVPWLALQGDRHFALSFPVPAELRSVLFLLALSGLGYVLYAYTFLTRFARVYRPRRRWVPGRLITWGPYALLRNPGYSGELLFFLSLALALGSPFLLAWTLGFGLFLRFVLVPWEETNLRRAFGRAYARYQRLVPRWPWSRLLARWVGVPGS